MPTLYLESLAFFLTKDNYFVALDMLEDSRLDRGVRYDRCSDPYPIAPGYQQYAVECNGVVRVSFQMWDNQPIFFANRKLLAGNFYDGIHILVSSFGRRIGYRRESVSSCDNGFMPAALKVLSEQAFVVLVSGLRLPH